MAGPCGSSTNVSAGIQNNLSNKLPGISQSDSEAFKNSLSSATYDLRATTAGGATPGAASGQGDASTLLQRAEASGNLRFTGPWADEARQIYQNLFTGNPQVAAALESQMAAGKTLTINTQDTQGGTPNANVGNSQVNAIGGDTITLDKSDLNLANRMLPGAGMNIVAAHELMHILGMMHGAEMDNASAAVARNTIMAGNMTARAA